MPQFLIVTPSFNQAHFIDQTIKSVLTQSGSDVQYWVMDGKSTDQTKEVLKQYGKKIQWLSEKDKGQTDAINKGIAKFLQKYANQKDTFFAYINSDDYYLPNVFDRVADAFTAHPEAMWIVGDCQIIDARNKEIHRPIRIYKKVLRWFYQPWLLSIINPIPQPAVFIRWSAVQTVGKFDEQLRYTMDYEYWLRLQQQVGAPLMLEETLAAFRIHGESKGGSAFIKQFDEQYQVAQRYTKNGLLLLLHRLHNGLIKTIYEVIK